MKPSKIQQQNKMQSPVVKLGGKYYNKSVSSTPMNEKTNFRSIESASNNQLSANTNKNSYVKLNSNKIDQTNNFRKVVKIK